MGLNIKEIAHHSSVANTNLLQCTFIPESCQYFPYYPVWERLTEATACLKNGEKKRGKKKAGGSRRDSRASKFSLLIFFWLSTKLLLPLPPVCQTHRLSSQAASTLNSPCLTVTLSSCSSPSSLPSPGALYYPLRGSRQDPGPPAADPVPLGRLFFFCSQNHLNNSGGKKGRG